MTIKFDAKQNLTPNLVDIGPFFFDSTAQKLDVKTGYGVNMTNNGWTKYFEECILTLGSPSFCCRYYPSLIY